MAEEGKRKSLSNLKNVGKKDDTVLGLSTVDNSIPRALELSTVDNSTHKTSEPKAKPEPRKPEKINVREARAKTKTDPY